MLPQNQIEEGIFTIPKINIEKQDVESFMEKLKGFHNEFEDCFNRSEPREHFFQYMVGQFSELERKSIEPIALNVEGGKVRGMQRFLSDVYWDEEKMLFKYHGMIKDDMGDENGVLIFDEAGFPKKGKDSVGVAKQYCGNLGKVENCQVGVFSAYACKYGYALLDKRLFLPEKWFTKEAEDRREKCMMPEVLEFKTKPQLAVEMFHGIQKEGVIPFSYVVADTIYGNSPEFIEAIESSKGSIYFVSIACDTLCWLKDPAITEKQYKYRGKKRIKKVVQKGEKKPSRVDSIAKNINDYFWYRRKVSEGTKGPIEYEFTKRQVILCRDALPDRKVWLIVKRTLEKKPTYSYYISNAPVNTRLKTFVWLSGIRWAIEQCFEETKTELGMDHYEVRKYPGWNHHILTCMLAHFFLWHLRISLGKKNTIYYSIAA
ncbi:MAG: IS701 family transposase [Candidatus Methanoperedens sp.]|nr:MAG: IS701 family transposase [Candidatus Methanoperedens sp.]